MGLTGLGRSFYKWLKENDKVRELTIYVVFLVLFSVVSFASKPGSVQYFLNDFHRTTLSMDLVSVKTPDDIYSWLDGPFAGRVFPEVNQADGQYWEGLERLYISGEYARNMGALRLRHVRSQVRECVAPSFLRTVNGIPIDCVAEYSDSTRRDTAIYAEGTLERAAVDSVDLGVAFEYQTAEELNSTDFFDEGGTFGSYGQDGYNLDIVPNIPPVVLAAYVSECRRSMMQAVEQCRLGQGMSPYNAAAAAAAAAAASGSTSTPTPTPTPIPLRRRLMQFDNQTINPDPTPFATCRLDDSIEPMLVGVDTTQCTFAPGPQDRCQLRYVGFHLMRELLQDATEPEVDDADDLPSLGCRNCKCPNSNETLCVNSCSPKLLFRKQLGLLQDASWIDPRETRAVFIDVTVFNQNYNLFTTFRGFFEIPTIGGVVGRALVQTFRIHRYVSSGDAIILGLEIVFYAFVLFYTLQELREIYKLRWKYFQDPWNVMDWANLIILYTVLGMRAGATLISNGFEAAESDVVYTDFITMGALAIQELNLSALNFFLLYFKIFKYLHDIPRMDAILLTITGAALDLFLFVIMAGIVLLGFAAAFYVCFGMFVADFRTVSDSLGSLIQALLGVFDYQALQQANYVMAPLLFYIYMAVVYFVLLSMFIAILDDSYGMAKEQQSEEDLKYYQTLYKSALVKVSGWVGQKHAAKNLVQDLMNADQGDTVDGLLDEQELEAVLSKNPRALKLLRATNVKQLIAKYDINQDGMLDREELLEMVDMLVTEAGEMEEQVKVAQVNTEEKDEDEIPDSAVKVQKEIVSVQDKVQKVDTQLKDLSRNTARKLGLMIDLMMSLSDQIATTGQVLPGMAPQPAALMAPQRPN